MSANPGWIKGYIPTAAEWNGEWSSKLDTNNPVATGSLVLNGTGPITGFGTDPGDLLKLVSSGASNFPMVNPTTRMVFRRSGPTSIDVTDFQFDRDTTTATGGAGTTNRVVGISFVAGPNETGDENGLIVQGVVNTTAPGLAPVHYGIWSQMVRSATGRGHCTGIVSNVYDNTGLSSGTAGVANLLGYEADVYGNGIDDGPNVSTWGGFGVRRLASMVAGRAIAGSDIVEFAAGYQAGTRDGVNVSLSAGFAIGNGSNVLIGLDTRGALTPAGMTDPVAAVRMLAGQIVDFNGGATLRAAPGNYLQYTITGTARLRYMVGATERFTLPDTKPTVTGSRAGNAALASLLTALAAANLVTDSSSA